MAGSFYPGSAGQLEVTVADLLAAARACSRSDLRGIIVPHAGYVYSGPVAASAYTCLRSSSARPIRLVIIGPSHFEPLYGLAVTGASSWRTPLGEVAVDDAGRARLSQAGAVVDDRPHRSEHSLEVQLPFLQRCCPGVPVLPVAVGQGSADEAARMLAAVLPAGAVLVVSTDLSHYHDAATARRLDARTAAAVEALDVGSIDADDACGADALRAAMAWARDEGLHVERLDVRDSAHTVGDPERVVGYGAFVITAARGSPRARDAAAG